MKKILPVVLLITFILQFYTVHAKREIKFDTADVNVRMPEASIVSEIKADSDFNYKLASRPDESFFSWLKYKIYKFLSVLFSDKAPAVAIRWILVIAFLIFILLKILKVTPQSLFYKNKKSISIPSGEFSEDISGIDFEKLISEEITNGNYRRAIRYMYLRILKILSDKNFIEWSVYKTNQDYQKEMKSTEFNSRFIKLSSLFEFTWYGDFRLNVIIFEKIQSEFSEFYQHLNKS